MQVCAFAKKCPNDNCTQIVDYTEDIVKYPIISAIADEEIKKDVFGYADLDSKSLSNTISLPETKEMAAEVMSTEYSNSNFNMAVHQQGKQKSSKNFDLNSLRKLNVKRVTNRCQNLSYVKARLKSLAIVLIAGMRNALMLVTPSGQYLML